MNKKILIPILALLLIPALIAAFPEPYTPPEPSGGTPSAPTQPTTPAVGSTEYKLQSTNPTEIRAGLTDVLSDRSGNLLNAQWPSIEKMMKEGANKDLMQKTVAQAIRGRASDGMHPEWITNGNDMRERFIKAFDRTPPADMASKPEVAWVFGEYYGSTTMRIVVNDERGQGTEDISYKDNLKRQLGREPTPEDIQKEVSGMTTALQAFEQNPSLSTSGLRNQIITNIASLYGQTYTPLVEKGRDGKTVISTPVVPSVVMTPQGKPLLGFSGSAPGDHATGSVLLGTPDIKDVVYGDIDGVRAFTVTTGSEDLSAIMVNGKLLGGTSPPGSIITVGLNDKERTLVSIKAPPLAEGTEGKIQIGTNEKMPTDYVTACDNCKVEFDVSNGKLAGGSGKSVQHIRAGTGLIEGTPSTEVDVWLTGADSSTTYETISENLKNYNVIMKSAKGVTIDGSINPDRPKDPISPFHIPNIKEAADFRVGKIDRANNPGQPQLMFLGTFNTPDPKDPKSAQDTVRLGETLFTPKGTGQTLLIGGLEENLKVTGAQTAKNKENNLGPQFNGWVKDARAGKTAKAVLDAIGSALPDDPDYQNFAKNYRSTQGSIFIDGADTEVVVNGKAQGPSHTFTAAQPWNKMLGANQVGGASYSPDVELILNPKYGMKPLDMDQFGMTTTPAAQVIVHNGETFAKDTIQAEFWYQTRDKQTLNQVVAGPDGKSKLLTAAPNGVEKDLHCVVDNVVATNGQDRIFRQRAEIEDHASTRALKFGEMPVGQGWEITGEVIDPATGKVITNLGKIESGKGVITDKLTTVGRETVVPAGAFSANGEYSLGRQSRALFGADRKVLLKNGEDTGMRVDSQGRIFSKMGIEIGQLSWDPSVNKFVPTSHDTLFGKEMMTSDQKANFQIEKGGFTISDGFFFDKFQKDNTKWRTQNIAITTPTKPRSSVMMEKAYNDALAMGRTEQEAREAVEEFLYSDEGKKILADESAGQTAGATIANPASAQDCSSGVCKLVNPSGPVVETAAKISPSTNGKYNWENGEFDPAKAKMTVQEGAFVLDLFSSETAREAWGEMGVETKGSRGIFFEDATARQVAAQYDAMGKTGSVVLACHSAGCTRVVDTVKELQKSRPDVKVSIMQFDPTMQTDSRWRYGETNNIVAVTNFLSQDEGIINRGLSGQPINDPRVVNVPLKSNGVDISHNGAPKAVKTNTNVNQWTRVVIAAAQQGKSASEIRRVLTTKYGVQVR